MYLIRATIGMRNQQNLYPKALTAVAKLLRYSGSKVELRDGFSSYGLIFELQKWISLWIKGVFKKCEVYEMHIERNVK